jgi:hypothetical protein
MKNSNDSLKEKAIKQERVVDLNELESTSGGWFWEGKGTYWVDANTCHNAINKLKGTCDKCYEKHGCAAFAYFIDSYLKILPCCSRCGTCFNDNWCSCGAIKYSST